MLFELFPPPVVAMVDVLETLGSFEVLAELALDTNLVVVLLLERCLS